MCWPVCGEVSLLTLGCGEGNAGFIGGHQTDSPGQLVLQTPELLERFHESVFKVQVGGAVVTGYVINSCTVL